MKGCFNVPGLMRYRDLGYPDSIGSGNLHKVDTRLKGRNIQFDILPIHIFIRENSLPGKVEHLYRPDFVC